ncbi:MarR family winged helix-turn-helix transcriptional regulator [uncultured Ruminococcus sp.]|uniref:MarR family winged helix-turn-helix transcriptional regulator n=1 Tax=uncultured Ruminococcus sp. TaxID=165186 RepID=UPI0026010209|nr:MarR family transcriptional regulator [uncultured Ruminococcus sp.]
MKIKDDHTKMPRLLLNRKDAKPSMFVNDVSRMFMHRVRRECEKNGVPNGYHKILMELSHNDGATQLQLVKLTHLTAPTVSVALGKMESEGLVTRQTDTADMRVMKVCLTDKGRGKVESVREIFHRADDVLVKGIPQEELDSAMKVLRKMLENLLEEEDK